MSLMAITPVLVPEVSFSGQERSHAEHSLPWGATSHNQDWKRNKTYAYENYRSRRISGSRVEQFSVGKRAGVVSSRRNRHIARRPAFGFERAWPSHERRFLGIRERSCQPQFSGRPFRNQRLD